MTLNFTKVHHLQWAMRLFFINRRRLVFCVLFVGVCTLCLMFINRRLHFSPISNELFLISDKSLNVAHHRHSTISNLNDINFIKQKLVIYNRVPKTASTSLVNLVYELLIFNPNVRIIHVNISNGGYYLNRLNQMELVHNLTNWISMQPLMVHGHFVYLNFQQYGSSFEPIYINMIRDPLERFVSYYYFRRFGDDYDPNVVRKFMSDPVRRNQSFDDCIMNLESNKAMMEYLDCDPRYLWLQVPYFCGQANYCRIPGNPEAVQTAKRHVTENYLLVGLTERFNQTVDLLEHMLPHFFQGSSSLLAQPNGWRLRRTRVKYPINQNTINFFRQNAIWQAEQSFYDFVSTEFKFTWNAVYGNGRKRKRKLTKRHRGQYVTFDKIR